ncbi:Putative ribosomal N-acetyltransferase YdaF [Anaerococcus prevotii]|uniref:GCN5-related N-acetyltransferase n=1 Tax=Anaerococcus prevotii (strain ATCC 9321 / DSM 20548 / JCM 6508 / NCTC 11806 / PC1) TaxID=525919 RepID=C7RDE0_ANAPD|nr:GNAT family N-acetyltransferase [Anaerococcus prevotii]ACV29203.1 GCN5-related N-acetyltransferase [Anaerococcus prevotii DSM 20548]SUU94878.1 Putative ribosomal N-acetyltransferase YdaF [Anaerococcus prevotii]
MKINTDKITLKGERIKLRAFREGDLDDFYNYAKTPGLGEAAGWFHHKSKEESKEILDTFIKDKNILAIEKDGRVIGSIGIHKYDEEFFDNLTDKKAAELGFVLATDFQNQGIMTEALEILISYLFDEVGLETLVGGFYRGNFISKKIHEKLNYKYYSSHLTKTNMGTMEVTHEYILSKEDFKNYLANKTKEESEDGKKEEDKSKEEYDKQVIYHKDLKLGEEVLIKTKYPNTLIFVRIGLIEYKSGFYPGGDLLKLDNEREIKLKGLSDSEIIVVESDLR